MRSGKHMPRGGGWFNPPLSYRNLSVVVRPLEQNDRNHGISFRVIRRRKP
jgi:hypothetical protein